MTPEERAIRTALPRAALETLCAAWNCHYGSYSNTLRPAELVIVHRDHDAPTDTVYVRLSTGGWSDNERLIDAFRANRLAWLETWEFSARGGLFIFKMP